MDGLFGCLVVAFLHAFFLLPSDTHLDLSVQWDRQPFLTDVLDGTPSLIKALDVIHHNFFIGV